MAVFPLQDPIEDEVSHISPRAAVLASAPARPSLPAPGHREPCLRSRCHHSRAGFFQVIVISSFIIKVIPTRFLALSHQEKLTRGQTRNPARPYGGLLPQSGAGREHTQAPLLALSLGAGEGRSRFLYGLTAGGPVQGSSHRVA